jgi:prepilin-type N-terminal cleavage/methylation domain-containing protein
VPRSSPITTEAPGAFATLDSEDRLLLWAESGESSRGFTLVELLIVIAIVAILAVIAVPNFLEAQVRGKVSRSLSDIRSLALALEAYAVDHRGYPPYAVIPPDQPVEDPALTVGQDHFECFSRRPFSSLTTPVAYIRAYPPDILARTGPDVTSADTPERPYLSDYSYKNPRYNAAIWPGVPEPWLGPGGSRFVQSWGEWRLVGAGPDGTRIQDVKLNIIYDPTNGSRSRGDLVRTQRRPANQPRS